MLKIVFSQNVWLTHVSLTLCYPQAVLSSHAQTPGGLTGNVAPASPLLELHQGCTRSCHSTCTWHYDCQTAYDCTCTLTWLHDCHRIHLAYAGKRNYYHSLWLRDRLTSPSVHTHHPFTSWQPMLLMVTGDVTDMSASCLEGKACHCMHSAYAPQVW